jgi:carbon-monoxide dehydrogenase large subunit
MSPSGSILGHAVLRREDPKILEGEARYFDDLSIDGLLHVVFVRSTIAHAEILSVDTSEATGLPGVVSVYSGDDLDLAPIQGFVMLPPVFARPPFAKERVRFVGDIVAAVIAETRAQAVDAAEQVVVDYEPLPTVVDPEAALAEGAPLLFPEHGSNLAIQFAFGEEPTVFDGADVVVSERLVNQRVAVVPMEGNGIVAIGDDEGGLLCYVPTQNPHGLVQPLAEATGLA